MSLFFQTLRSITKIYEYKHMRSDQIRLRIMFQDMARKTYWVTPEEDVNNNFARSITIYLEIAFIDQL